MTLFLKRTNKPNLAYHHFTPDLPSELAPVIFLGGFRSDMEGTKAIFLQDQCIAAGREYVRFDYSGHGQSEGKFEECILSDWLQDAIDLMESCFDKPALVVGSSMGGWIGLALGDKKPEIMAGFGWLGCCA